MHTPEGPADVQWQSFWTAKHLLMRIFHQQELSAFFDNRHGGPGTLVLSSQCELFALVMDARRQISALPGVIFSSYDATMYECHISWRRPDGSRLFDRN